MFVLAIGIIFCTLFLKNLVFSITEYFDEGSRAFPENRAERRSKYGLRCHLMLKFLLCVCVFVSPLNASTMKFL